MDDMNPRAVMGANNPPDPIDAITAPFDDARDEASNWLDGQTVITTEAQMKACDELRGSMRTWRIKLEAGQKEATAPLRAIADAEFARWKPTIADAKLIEAGLVATVDTFKRKLAAEKEAAAEAARKAAWEATRAAQETARQAAASDLEAQRAAQDAIAAAEAAQRASKAADKETVKGLRTVWKYEITDHKALLNWIARNDREAITTFIENYAAAKYRKGDMDGLRTWSEKEAF